MNQIPCLGLNFLAKCSESHITEHFLFNLETAISGLAVFIAIYALVLEKRFQVRIALKKHTQKKIIGMIIVIFILTFIGAILPFIPGYAPPLLGYPIFWEMLASFLLFFGIYFSFRLFKPIYKLTKKEAKNLNIYAPHTTSKYQDSLNLILKESEYFWNDFLKKTINDEELRETFIIYFSQLDFLKMATKSHKILIGTINFVSKNRVKNITHIEDFLRKLILSSLDQSESILSDDLISSYKPITQYILRECKLDLIIFGDTRELFFLKTNSKNLNQLCEYLIEIFHMYLGRKYHYQDDEINYTDLINIKILENMLDFFKDSINLVEDEKRRKLLNKLSHHYTNLQKLDEEKSTVLANGIYDLLENYASEKDWSKKPEIERLSLIDLHRNYIECNEFTKKIFKERLLKKIVGSTDTEEKEKYFYNLIGYYPMMVPIYFYIYGNELFSEKTRQDNLIFHLTILKTMQENLPKLAVGKIQEYFDEINLPQNEDDIKIVKNRAQKIMSDIFPLSVFYDKDKNSITYFYSGKENHDTILLNETKEQNKIVFEKK
ncbi:MAG: hypothetical protein COX80_04715 [Candidatus Magasanikbacteria bacterium CG_4_10_14_0_2_um_filter_33_14]|uniref:Uncharacterized protein n=1 Tax=Candidatus Magasanikbacteria bacterium CG_4_10_14_0_2_um_filter_33_14 TaxID=1974636 RepID=A0A2M7V925_9BACT|nr:MAG: hypothetical protein COX80_04715 [Candidatus Magasanikbacteria bacterium CG_4_10_14_0_2_um_filter_33_14]